MPKLKSDGFGRPEAPTHGSRRRMARPARHAEGVGPMEAGQAFTTWIDSRNDVTSIALGGELDMATVPMLAEQLTAVEQDGPKVIMLDLRGLRFIDSSGLHEFVRAHRRSLLNGHRLVFVGANPSARRLCEITGTEFLLDAKGTAEVLGRFTSDGAATEDQDGVAGTESHA